MRGVLIHGLGGLIVGESFGSGDRDGGIGPIMSGCGVYECDGEYETDWISKRNCANQSGVWRVHI